MLTLGQESSTCLHNMGIVWMHVGCHVQRPLHVFVSAEVLQQDRDVEEHVEVLVQVRAERIEGGRRGLH